MKDYVITCCSTVDLTNEYLNDNDVKYLGFKYLLNGIDYVDDMGKTITANEFFKKIEDGAMPTTSQINSERYISFWEPILQEGKDIIHITLSSGISGSYNSAILAKQYLDEKYPESKLEVIDSLAASSGYGMIVSYLIDLKKEGKTIEELKKWALDNRLNVHHWFTSTDLTSYRRGGRISSTSFFIGQLLKICPLMNVDLNGKLMPRKKIRTKEKALKSLVESMENCAKDRLNYDGKCFICNSACYDDAEKVKQMVEEKFPNLVGKVEIYNIGAVIGAHSGPGTTALFFIGDKRID